MQELISSELNNLHEPTEYSLILETESVRIHNLHLHRSLNTVEYFSGALLQLIVNMHFLVLHVNLQCHPLMKITSKWMNRIWIRTLVPGDLDPSSRDVKLATATDVSSWFCGTSLFVSSTCPKVFSILKNSSSLCFFWWCTINGYYKIDNPNKVQPNQYI